MGLSVVTFLSPRVIGLMPTVLCSPDVLYDTLTLYIFIVDRKKNLYIHVKMIKICKPIVKYQLCAVSIFRIVFFCRYKDIEVNGLPLKEGHDFRENRRSQKCANASIMIGF